MFKPVPATWRVSSTYQDHLDREPPSSAPGIDIACPVGTPIISPDSGTVQYVNWTPAGGRGMWLKYDGWRMYLAHLNAANAFRTERVRGGQRIAISGNTGRTTGPHLHLSVQAGGAWVDPHQFLYATKSRRLRYIGVHLPNNVTPEDARFLGKHLNIFKGLMRLDKPVNPVGDNDALDLPSWDMIRHEAPEDSIFVLRAYANMQHGPMDGQVFTYRTLARVFGLCSSGGPLAGANVRLEIHNEPNHPDEGWGPTETGATLFDRWYRLVYNQIQHSLNERDLPNVKLMWPGLAPAEWSHKERTWMRVCEDSIISSPSIGVHCYWQTKVDNYEQLIHPQLGLNWKAYDDLLKRRERTSEIIVTEAGNSNCHSNNHPNLDASEQAAQYVLWCKNAVNGVNGVTFFLWGAMHPWEGFRVHRHTVESLGEYRKTLG